VKKKKMKTKIVMLVGLALCTMLLVSPALASDVDTLEIYGNANEDDTIDMRDLTYVKLIFFGKKPETELADAKYDGKINPLDFIQIKLITVGKENATGENSRAEYRYGRSDSCIRCKGQDSWCYCGHDR
jgi:hypothetical protein